MKSDKRRINAALAACEGIDTYALELMTGPLLIVRQIESRAMTPKKKEAAKTTALRQANAALVCALDRIHDVLTGEYVDDVAMIVNAALAKNALTESKP